MRLEGAQSIAGDHDSGSSGSLELGVSRTLPAAIEVGSGSQNEDDDGNELRCREAGDESSWVITPELNHKARDRVERGIAKQDLAFELPSLANQQQEPEDDDHCRGFIKLCRMQVQWRRDTAKSIRPDFL